MFWFIFVFVVRLAGRHAVSWSQADTPSLHCGLRRKPLPRTGHVLQRTGARRSDRRYAVCLALGGWKIDIVTLLLVLMAQGFLVHVQKIHHFLAQSYMPWYVYFDFFLCCCSFFTDACYWCPGIAQGYWLDACRAREAVQQLHHFHILFASLHKYCHTLLLQAV